MKELEEFCKCEDNHFYLDQSGVKRCLIKSCNKPIKPTEDKGLEEIIRKTKYIGMVKHYELTPDWCKAISNAITSAGYVKLTENMIGILEGQGYIKKSEIVEKIKKRPKYKVGKLFYDDCIIAIAQSKDVVK